MNEDEHRSATEDPTTRRERQEAWVERHLATLRQFIPVLAAGQTDSVVFSFVKGSREFARDFRADAPDLLERFERETEQMLAGLVFAPRAFREKPDSDGSL